jgi:3',5'-cyclic AMP phosphodiesterase CpdA
VSETVEALPAGRVRIAAAGDLHVHEAVAERWYGVVAGLTGVDLILLAGDLTADGLASQSELLARACRDAPAPVAAVLRNHDWHLGEEEGITAALRGAGVRVLERESAVYRVGDITVGVVGMKGFVGGFLDSRIPDFGEPLLRRVYPRRASTSTRSNASCAASRTATPASSSCTTRPRRHGPGLHRVDTGVERRRAAVGVELLDLRAGRASGRLRRPWRTRGAGGERRSYRRADA